MASTIWELRSARVALLAEGVDRNCYGRCTDRGDRVALLAEGVDRNNPDWTCKGKQYTSPSSRRAWIEISADFPREKQERVALLAEGVDRNRHAQELLFPLGSRPPRGGRG